MAVQLSEEQKTLLGALEKLKVSTPEQLEELLKSRTETGMHSLSLWGPGEGRVAYTPFSLSKHQWEGAHMRFICFLGPLACTARSAR